MQNSFFELVIFLVASGAGAVAAVSGFGIGSLLTPLLSLHLDTKLAVALVSVPHLCATGLRFYMLRAHLDRKLFLSFGIMSAVGGLTGALLHSYVNTSMLTLVFGGILIFAGFTGATGISERMRLSGGWARIAGLVSGFLGGMVGNQGGIRSAALLGSGVSKECFVATATAVGLVVDVARMPIYFWSEHQGLSEQGTWIGISTLGVIVGTFLGMRLLKKLSDKMFRRSVSAIIFCLGVFMLVQGMRM